MNWLKRLFADGTSTSAPASRLPRLKAMGEWGGLLVSKDGDSIMELGGNREAPAGEWLYFMFLLRTLPDHRIIFAATACFWMKVPRPITVRGMSNMYRPLPQEITGYISPDESYAEWAKAFDAIGGYFDADTGWRNQWSWRTDEVSDFMAGKCPGWISRIEA